MPIIQMRKTCSMIDEVAREYGRKLASRPSFGIDLKIFQGEEVGLILDKIKVNAWISADYDRGL